MRRHEIRRLRERLREHQLGDFASAEELDRAIEEELSKMPPEQAERFVRQFAVENNLPLMAEQQKR